MTIVHSPPSPVDAALLFTAKDRLAKLGLPRPTGSQILAATGVSRSRAYELKSRLELELENLVGPVGRPPGPEPSPPPSNPTGEVLLYLLDHPGSVTGSPERRRYSDGFRHRILDLVEQNPKLSLEALASASFIPIGTLRDWVATSTGPSEPPSRSSPQAKSTRRALSPHLETVLAEWKIWKGPFSPFCEHLRRHCGLPFGRTLIGRILEAEGLRRPKRRRGRSPDELALREAFSTWFPHAQWVGDGSLVPVEVDGELFVFNVELSVDAYSGAFLGAAVSRAEDSDAVIGCFRDAIGASGTRPLALLLDNKPCNLTSDVQGALGDTLRIPATLFRPQNKAHCEGGFGLLKPTLSGLHLEGDCPSQLAASFLQNLVIAVSRVLNRRPRADRGGRCRSDLLHDGPSDHEIEAARKNLRERLRKQKLARQTLAARQDPVVRGTLAAAYDRLKIDDPDGHILTATARYPLDAVVEGVAIFEGRRRVGSLSSTAGGRYLLGIVRNLAEEKEGQEIALALWEARVAAGDLLTRRLARHHAALASAKPKDPIGLLKDLVDQALGTPSQIERFFWLSAAADVLLPLPPSQRRHAFRVATRRIHATHSVPHRERLGATRFLAAKVLPLR